MPGEQMKGTMQKITPFLWFNENAEEAARFYATVFKKSKVGAIARYDEAGEKVSGRPAGSVMTVEFQIEGQDFIALNGGPMFKFNESISFFVNCENQAEVDALWAKLTADGGEESMCGWLKDKYGLSWQIIPKALGELMGDPDPVKAQRVTQAMLQMKKIDVDGLQRAYDQK